MTRARAGGMFGALAILAVAVLVTSGCTTQTSNGYIAVFLEKGEDPLIKEGFTQQGMTTQFEFTVNRTNLTKLEFTLGWSEDSGDGCDDLLEMTIVSASPSAVYKPEQTVQGTRSIKITAVLETVPKNRQGNDEQELEDHIRSMAHDRGAGDWTVKVTCVSTANDCEPQPGHDDRGNSWVLTVNILYFEGQVTENTWE